MILLQMILPPQHGPSAPPLRPLLPHVQIPAEPNGPHACAGIPVQQPKESNIFEREGAEATEKYRTAYRVQLTLVAPTQRQPDLEYLHAGTRGRPAPHGRASQGP